MSKAFLPEDSAVEEEIGLPSRPPEPLPITRAGLASLRAERARIANDDAHRSRLRALDRILATVVVQDAELIEGRASFGCAIVVEDERGARKRYVLVGPDEVDAKAGRISAQSPLGQALIGRRAGDAIELERAGRVDELTVIDVRIDDA